MINKVTSKCGIYNLAYRGVTHTQKITSIQSRNTNTRLKYRGAAYQKSAELSVLKSESLFNYRGIKYVRSLQLLCL